MKKNHQFRMPVCTICYGTGYIDKNIYYCRYPLVLRDLLYGRRLSSQKGNIGAIPCPECKLRNIRKQPKEYSHSVFLFFLEEDRAITGNRPYKYFLRS